MKKIRKREFSSSELLQKMAKLYDFETKIFALEMKQFLVTMLDEQTRQRISGVHLEKSNFYVEVKNSIARDFLHRQRFFLLQNLQEEFGEEKVSEIYFVIDIQSVKLKK